MNRPRRQHHSKPKLLLRRRLPSSRPLRKEPGSTYKRCGCSDPLTGHQLDTKCPLLRWSDHGSWYFYLPLPTLNGRRQRVRRGGYDTESEAGEALQAEIDLAEEAGLITRRLAVPDPAFQIHLDHLARVPRKTPRPRFGVRREVRRGVRTQGLIRPSLMNRRKDSS